MVHQLCLLSAVFVALCLSLAVADPPAINCPEGDTGENGEPVGLEYLKLKWAKWAELNDVNKDNMYDSQDYELLGDHLGQERGYNDADTASIKAALVASMIKDTPQSYIEFVDNLANHYTSDFTVFEHIIGKYSHDFIHALHPNTTTVSETSIEADADALGDSAIIPLISKFYHLLHNDENLSLDELVSGLTHELTAPCPSSSGILGEIVKEDHQ